MKRQQTGLFLRRPKLQLPRPQRFAPNRKVGCCRDDLWIPCYYKQKVEAISLA